GGERRVPVEHRGRAAGEDHRLRLHRLEGRLRLLERHDLAIHLLLADAPGDELGDLRAEVDDEDLVVVRAGFGRHGQQLADRGVRRNRGGGVGVDWWGGTLSPLIHLILRSARRARLEGWGGPLRKSGLPDLRIKSAAPQDEVDRRMTTKFAENSRSSSAKKGRAGRTP